MIVYIYTVVWLSAKAATPGMSQHPVYTAVVLDVKADRFEATPNTAATWQKRLWKFNGVDARTKLPTVVPLENSDYTAAKATGIVLCKLNAPGAKNQQVSAQIKGMVEVGQHTAAVPTVPECCYDYSASSHSSTVVLV